jgi:deoxycytidylate deaminase
MRSNKSELVFGLVYPVGTDADPVVKVLKDYLRQFDYKASEIRVSKLLRNLNHGVAVDDSSSLSEMDTLIKAGNAAREISQKQEMMAVHAINEIQNKRPRETDGGAQARPSECYIIRSLKRPEEAKLLRNVYRPGFFLIAIASNDDQQEKYLTKRKGLANNHARALMRRDQDEKIDYGQRTRDTFYLADVFVQLTGERYKDQLQDFLDLVFGHPFITPTRQENAMFMAYASSARSAQPGRQVGAAIATKDGEVVSVGCNEVPKRNGGLYWQGDEPDHRDHRLKEDSNYEQKQEIVRSILRQLRGRLFNEQNLKRTVDLTLEKLNSTVVTDKDQFLKHINSELGNILISRNDAEKVIGESKLKDITEYGRAVHAEMDALLTCARLGISVRGLVLYTTTFPCHNCTRHIIASGISKVVYIEPYPKSKARHLHSDSICFEEKEAKQTGKIPFLPFVGVGPRRYLDLFSLELTTGVPIERKFRGKPKVWSRKSHDGPRVPMSPLSYLDRESKVLVDYEPELQKLLRRNENGTDNSETSNNQPENN